jgi:magnesium chelatase family protein
MLAAEMNPGPCGFFGDPTCQCHGSLPQIERYVSKISGPLIDRIDIHIKVPAVKYEELRGNGATEDSATIRERALRALDRILKVARTFADLDASENLETRHLGEAIQYRTLDRT